MSAAAPAARVRRPLFTTGVVTLLAFMAVGFTFGFARFIVGIGPVTNLSDAYPWGIWIAIDVACGVALAAGGFTSAFLIEIAGGHRYKPLLRPAILTAWLGYAMVAFALLFDLGRYWNVWRPIFNWQGNSVLFEVGMCVMAYLFVLTVEMAPALLEGLRERVGGEGRLGRVLTRLDRPLTVVQAAVNTMLPLFILAGVVLSCMHQSSLGTLMVIAPTKVSPLFYTPIMPLLFLASAIMVGFPMVVFESIIASKSLRRPVEMKLLSPLAGKIPWIIGAYLALKLGDLLVRREQIDLLARPTATISLLAEIVFGLILPAAMLIPRKRRESVGNLFLAALLVVLGVALNRINVFLVAYAPPIEGSYFPAVGEIAVTGAIVCMIMFLYRLMVTWFPVLEAHDAAGRPEAAPPVAQPRRWVGLIYRAVAVGLLGLFALLYGFVHHESIAEAERSLQAVYAPKRTNGHHPPRQITAVPHDARPKNYQNAYLMDAAVLRDAGDDYEPVRFSHRSHDNATGGNCAACHHRHAMEEGDRVGFDLDDRHAEMGVTLGAPCGECHDVTDGSPQACDRCHGAPNERDAPARIGLKAAYHRQCVGCHEKLASELRAPTRCNSCHYPNVPDHSTLVMVTSTTAEAAITTQCIGCHAESSRDVLASAHWKWSGHSPTVDLHEHDTRLGMRSVLNNYLGAVPGNARYCSACHIGQGWTAEGLDFDDATKIDCLVCHDGTGTYRRDVAGGGGPAASVDVSKVAGGVGRPSRESCGRCHFYSDGGPNVKHGDLEPMLARPPAELDVHMGRLDMRCQECHTVQDHRIAGRSMSAPASEGSVACERCHGAKPHGIAGVTGRHLNTHAETVACETCHIPMVARQTPTQTAIDYSMAGKVEPIGMSHDPSLVFGVLDFDELAQAAAAAPPASQPANAVPEVIRTFDPRFGVIEWTRNLVPTYAWYAGHRTAYALGDQVSADGPIVLNQPLGSADNPKARIYPFKVHRAMQPYDPQNRVLAAVKLVDGFWKDQDWDSALREGMKAARMTYSGQVEFVETRMYTAIHHEVLPARQALGCTDCHAEAAVTCSRCHQKAAGRDYSSILARRYPQLPRFLDFRALEYPDDPALSGSRFNQGMGQGAPVQ